LWRGTPDFPQKRVTDITMIYQSPDINLTQQLLQKYNIKYVVVGYFEKQKFTTLNEFKFNEISSPVFQSGQTTIYRLNY
jgi:uncharacterized membrane protein